MEKDKLILFGQERKSRQASHSTAIANKSQRVFTPAKPAAKYNSFGFFGYTGGKVSI